MRLPESLHPWYFVLDGDMDRGLGPGVVGEVLTDVLTPLAEPGLVRDTLRLGTFGLDPTAPVIDPLTELTRSHRWVSQLPAAPEQTLGALAAIFDRIQVDEAQLKADGFAVVSPVVVLVMGQVTGALADELRTVSDTVRGLALVGVAFDGSGLPQGAGPALVDWFTNSALVKSQLQETMRMVVRMMGSSARHGVTSRVRRDPVLTSR